MDHLEKLNLDDVRKELQPRVSEQLLARLPDPKDRELALDLDEAERTRRWLVERSVMTWNMTVDLHTRLDNLLENTILPLQTVGRVAKWLVSSAIAIGAIWGFFIILVKGKKP